MKKKPTKEVTAFFKNLEKRSKENQLEDDLAFRTLGKIVSNITAPLLESGKVTSDDLVIILNEGLAKKVSLDPSTVKVGDVARLYGFTCYTMDLPDDFDFIIGYKEKIVKGVIKKCEKRRKLKWKKNYQAQCELLKQLKS